MRDQGLDRGAAAILVLIAAIPILVGAAALGIDTARLQLAGQQVQRAADAAALAGVVFLPDEPQRAVQAATAVAATNAVGPGQVTVSRVPGYPSRLSVRVSQPVHHGFGEVLGVSGHTVVRTAVADFARPLGLGSPCNVLGNEAMPAWGGGVGQAPVATAACTGSSRLWLSLQGPDTNKEHGDAIAANRCVWGPRDSTPDGCDFSGFGPTPPGRNLEYRPGGYTYIVRVTRPGILRLQGYDLGWVSLGADCRGVGPNPAHFAFPLAGAEKVLTNEFVDVRPAASNARYATGLGTFCAGDTQGTAPYDADSPAALAMTTTVTARHPGISPWDPATGSRLCPAISLAGYEGRRAKLAPRLRTGDGGTRGLSLRRTFHRWADICPPVRVDPGDYTVTVASGGGGGTNRFALRAWLDGQVNGVAVLAQERLGAYLNIYSGTSLFHLVRLDSATAGRVLEVGVFDLGDAVAPIRVTILGAGSDKALSACDVSGAIQARAAPCSVVTQRSVSDSRWLRFRIPVPSNYRCPNDESVAACWIRVRIYSGQQVFDATTWSARMEGDPVRLVR